MEFEFDPTKSAANKVKHGLDFEEAQALWKGRVFTSPAIGSVEPRKLVVGKISGKYWTAVVTDRGDSIRIISVRRSRDKEIAIYENR